jgi:hypothetical protein
MTHIHTSRVIFALLALLLALGAPVGAAPVAAAEFCTNDGLRALYTFREGSGAIVRDVSGIGAPLNLTIADPAAVRWSADGLTIERPTIMDTRAPASPVIEAARVSGAVTVEAWVVPALRNQDGPARIVTISEDSHNHNVSLAQGLWGGDGAARYVARLRTTSRPDDAENPLRTVNGILRTELQHVVFTRDGAGNETLYVDGIVKARRTGGGDLSNWDAGYYLALGNDIAAERPWLGAYRRVALYDAALTPTQIARHFALGPGCDIPTPLDDLSSAPALFVITPPSPAVGGAARLRLTVQRSGGVAPIAGVAVRFYLGDPAAGGTLLGEATTPPIDPAGAGTTGEVLWTPAMPGNAQLYAVIDPDNLIAESDESNNTITRTVSVAADTGAPVIVSLEINGGAASTNDPAITLRAIAVDPDPGTGVRDIRFVELGYSPALRRWAPVADSGWLLYGAPSYPWILAGAPGVSYIQAVARDAAGNITAIPAQVSINFVPDTDTVAAGETRVYRYTLRTGDLFTARVEAISGDPDLTVFPPDTASGRPPWVSNLRGPIDEVSFTAPVSGEYQLEVYGYTAAGYRLRVTIIPAAALKFAGGIAPDKPLRLTPSLPLSAAPAPDAWRLRIRYIPWAVQP